MPIQPGAGLKDCSAAHLHSLTAVFLLCVIQQRYKECMLHIFHIQLCVRMWCRHTHMHNTCHQCYIYMQMERAHVGITPAGVYVWKWHVQHECMQPCYVQNTKLRWTSECQQAAWHWGRWCPRNSSHAAELAGAGSFPSYIRYTARIKAWGREEERAQGAKKEKPKWKEEGCVLGLDGRGE